MVLALAILKLPSKSVIVSIIVPYVLMFTLGNGFLSEPNTVIILDLLRCIFETFIGSIIRSILFFMRQLISRNLKMCFSYALSSSWLSNFVFRSEYNSLPFFRRVVTPQKSLYEIVPVNTTMKFDTDLKYQTVKKNQEHKFDSELGTVKIRYKKPNESTS